jgi:hypothetical protein
MLRKSLLVAVVLSLVAATASAQLLPRFGVKGGLNFSSIDVDDLDASTRTGYAFGAFVNLTAPGLSLQGELLYSRKGADFGAVPSREELNYREDVIQIPVLLRFSLPVPAVSPALYLGPAASIPLKSEYKLGDDDWVEIEEDGESLAWSVIIGADITLMDRLVLDLRYDWGLTAFREASFDDVTDVGSELKDRTFSAMVGYRF